MAPARDSEFLPEVWGLYSLGTIWILLRFAIRLRTDGISGLRLDDALAVIALMAWTYTCTIIQITYYTGTNTDFTATEIEKFDQMKYDQVVYGSKLFLGSWYAYLVLIFTLKGIVLLLYRRIFYEPWQKWVLMTTTGLSVLGFTALTLGFTLRCLPYHQRWQLVPRPPIKCTASPKILIATSCVNAVTDVFLLSVPVSLLWNLNKPLRTRLAVFILLASGVFVLAACIIRVSLTVVPNIFVLNIARWGVREFCIAIVAVNSAALRPMFCKSFWTNTKSMQQVRQTRNNYMFASAQRARHRLSGRRFGNQILNSTSNRTSTIDVYIQRELGDAEIVFDDPDNQMTSVSPARSTLEVTQGDIDLEKSGAFSTEMPRKDSAFPSLPDAYVDANDEGKSVSAEDKGPSQSRQ
ncbi:uncharacterized protein M421DRAFT_418776 [Didymella exigua CBS 183.55]|uniref:Rhodopsin domain-containing protein n=1 Tax=Didymella exigua CBS 183.55 TaxID=1150837 RepID=A0A6A5RYY3_9PLEO|nr:uncharacterized protein M421DRAFT_418776 [Didymella exigua CBS 183.55]KAF1930457.1 hypothetical protein M421DRAFT_418776 [Didymella exigua CBS 183.55]